MKLAAPLCCRQTRNVVAGGRIEQGLFRSSRKCMKRLLQLRVLRLGFLQDGNVVVGVFPEDEEVLVGTLRFGSVAGEDRPRDCFPVRVFSFRPIQKLASLPYSALIGSGISSGRPASFYRAESGKLIEGGP